ncbi:RDD family protein [Membranihabitans maritimus]|uniref:RDD family protein n=1 Tax=Membranihabitans maritimus TaxID=2904244 RepID=UPI001F20791C|nr:RDD family protein [Membranihabitans maritimus]
MYASIGKRLIAFILDILILAVIGGPLALFLGGKESFWYQCAIFLGYFSYFESSSMQGSFGKYIMKIQIENTNGGPISFLKAIIRNTIKCIPLEFIIALFSSKNRTLHDYIAGTIVTDKP